jgi:hypothetical protein
MHYFFEDLTGFAVATPLAVMLIVLPGFGVARIAARAALIPDRGSAYTCWSLLLGLAILPAADALLLRWIGFGGVLIPHIALALIGITSAMDSVRRIPPRWRLVVLASWLIVAWANVDFDWNSRLYQSVIILDGVKHSAVVAALAGGGLPLHDPFFARPGIAGYYYYFYLEPALLDWLGGAWIDSRAAFAAGTFVCLLAFVAVLLRLADDAALITDGSKQRFFRVVLLLCCISGLDLLPGLWLWMRTGHPYAQLDWWSEEVRWGLTSVLWVPHHVTAIIAVFTGCLIISSKHTGPLVPRAVLAGFAFATAFGSSLWIALAAVPILAIWWMWDRLRRSPVSMWGLPLSAIAALLLSIPQISDIYAGRTISDPPLTFYMRPVGPVRVLPHGLGEWIIHLIVTPGGFLIEFGIFALGSLAFARSKELAASRSTSIGRLLLVSAPVALILVTFVRSSVLYNDFGWRSVWFAEAPALLWTASVLNREPMKLRTSPVWAVAFALGLAATAWDLTGMRLIRPYYTMSEVNARPEIDYDERGAYRWVDRSLPANVILQHNPKQAHRALDFGLYANRPVGVADGEAKLFGAEGRLVQQRIAMVTPMFERPMPAQELHQRAKSAGVDVVLLTSADPLWQAGGGPPRDWKCQYRSAHSCVMLLEKPR